MLACVRSAAVAGIEAYPVAVEVDCAQGLPQFVRFTQEAQALVSRLDRIAAQLERDPARFILSSPAPDFRR